MAGASEGKPRDSSAVDHLKVHSRMPRKFCYVAAIGFSEIGFPLTPALSLRERECPRAALLKPKVWFISAQANGLGA